MAFQFWRFLLSTQKQTTLNARVFAALFHIFACLFLDILEISNGVESDIYCLKSIKDSLEDPRGILNASWDFSYSVSKFKRIENINLSDMGIRGRFPRGIKNCTTLTGLDLSNNELSGPLPSDIDLLVPFLTSLDLSGNKFSGQIPMSLSNCTYLNVLKLDHNHLTGEIPPELGHLPRLKQFSVSNNMLSGVVPYLGPNASITADDFDNNMKLCGAPLEPCPAPKQRRKFDSSFKGYAVFVVSVITFFYVPVPLCGLHE